MARKKGNAPEADPGDEDAASRLALAKFEKLATRYITKQTLLTGFLSKRIMVHIQRVDEIASTSQDPRIVLQATAAFADVAQKVLQSIAVIQGDKDAGEGGSPMAGGSQRARALQPGKPTGEAEG